MYKRQHQKTDLLWCSRGGSQAASELILDGSPVQPSSHVRDLSDACSQPTGTRSSIVTPTCQIQLRVIGVEVNLMWCLAAMSDNSAVYKMNSRGPNTEPCGTPWGTAWKSVTYSPLYQLFFTLGRIMLQFILLYYYAIYGSTQAHEQLKYI